VGQRGHGKNGIIIFAMKNEIVNWEQDFLYITE